MADFVEVARMREIPPGRMKRVEAHGGRITVANVNGTFFAFDDTCTHDAGPLCEGDLDGESVVCPWHFSRFSVRTGEVIDSPAHEPLRTYPVRVEGDAVLLGRLPG
jgi:3-phenylpropionate/trans-cinnamate dioxygenase ferredoxin subunit